MQPVMKTKQDNDLTNCIRVVYAKIETNSRDLSNWVQYVMKTIQNNDMIARTSAVYIEKKTKML